MKFGGRPRRLDVVFQVFDPPIYFVTLVTFSREPWLAANNVMAGFVEFGTRALADYQIAVGRFVLMPDHLHFFVQGGPTFRLGPWVGTLKRTLSRTARSHESTAFRWQEGFFDRLLRTDESLDAKWQYIQQNPVRAGLVKDANEWPFQGEISRIGCV